LNINDVTITSLETITAFDILTGEFRFVLDELQNAKISQSEDKTDITGKGGRKLNSLKKNKAVTVTGANGMVSGGLLETQTGGAFRREETAKVLAPDYLTVADNAAQTSFAAVGTAGNEIETVYLRGEDGSLSKPLQQAAEAAPGKFAYDPATKTLTFDPGDAEDGQQVVAYYFRTAPANVLENLSDQYSAKLALYIDAFAEDRCNNVYHVQFYIPRADFSGAFDLEMGENQTVHVFEAQSLAGSNACYGTGQSGALWTFTIFGNEE
jgi:hypothetical protein